MKRGGISLENKRLNLESPETYPYIHPVKSFSTNVPSSFHGKRAMLSANAGWATGYVLAEE